MRPEFFADEKKLEKVARYQSKDHQVIRDLRVKTLGKADTYIEGKVYCKLSDTEIDVDLYGDVPIEYAEKCVEAMNSMSEDLVDAICRAAKQYCLEYLDAVGGAELNEINLTIPVNENTPPREMLKYQLSGNCDWEEEHGIEIVILDDRLVYLGEFTDESPWTDHSEESWNAAASVDH